VSRSFPSSVGDMKEIPSVRYYQETNNNLNKLGKGQQTEIVPVVSKHRNLVWIVPASVMEKHGLMLNSLNC